MSQKQSNVRRHCLRDCKNKSNHQIADRTERNGITISKNDNNIKTEEEGTTFTINHKTRENWRARTRLKD